MTIRAVIFDFGGVIVRTEDQSPRLKWAERLGVTPEVLSATVFDSEAAAEATIGRVPAEAIWAHVAASLQPRRGHAGPIARRVLRGRPPR